MEKVCYANGCPGPRSSRGLCQKHYVRVRRSGSLAGSRRGHRYVPDVGPRRVRPTGNGWESFAARGLDFDPSRLFLSERLGDYYRVEEERGLLEEVHSFDPMRISGWCPSGLGWPAEEGTTILLARILGPKAQPGSWF